MDKSNIMRERALNAVPYKQNEERYYWFHRALAEVPASHSHMLRRARIEAYILDHYTLVIDEEDLLLGKSNTAFEMTPEREREAAAGVMIEKTLGQLCCGYAAQTGHRVLDYEKLLHLGINGVLAEIEKREAELNPYGKESSEKRDFYAACRISLNAVLNLARRFRQRALEEAEKTEKAERRNQLISIADRFLNAPAEPCRHFAEAIQIMWLLQFAMRQIDDISLTGRLDNYLWPFYESDIADGSITKAEAFALIEQLYYRHNEIYDSWPASVMVGGSKKDGSSNWNDLSELCIEAIRTTKLVNPSVAVCYNEDIPDTLLAKSVRCIAEGYTRPPFFNDRLIQSGLLDAGMETENARYYIHSTCVEITPVGASDVQVATPYININKAFEYILGEGKELFGDECGLMNNVTICLEQLECFEKFYNTVRVVTGQIIKGALFGVIKRLNGISKYQSSPLASCFIDNCLERGLDSGNGGAKYSYVYPCFPGFINFIDSLAAIEKAVYIDKRVTLRQLAEQCKDNFGNSEDLRRYLQNECPKFGNDDERADHFGIEMYDFIRKELKKYTTRTGATFHPSYFAWVMHGVLGERAAATPDGRKQGTALSEHLGAVQGFDRNGPTAVVRSVTKIDQKYGIGGIATNFRFSKGFLSTETGQKALGAFIRTCMESGCFEIQFNVVDQKDLIEAKEHPERFQTLMVRVAGYSDYFVRLRPDIQDEIIRRSEHSGV